MRGEFYGMANEAWHQSSTVIVVKTTREETQSTAQEAQYQPVIVQNQPGMEGPAIRACSLCVKSNSFEGSSGLRKIKKSAVDIVQCRSHMKTSHRPDR